ncbi:hypothetical protein [Flavihumibacter fluvii]|uniref:hypothetical protein n=1 Tax=Flavihumibacter fluvii TaxID=2838157 RepID=UPI001BDE9964|nr:hypothetical protein [Flavihumibacter fluvii]ULQ53236.1 hypothetical protein KJS93_02765 [Flavihumibacter fluvii]
MFDDNSRYKNAPTYAVKDRRGRTVTVVATPAPPLQSLLGFHVLKQGQHIDHLAGRYLNNPAAFWRIAEINEVMLPEAMTERKEIAIPNSRS